MIKDIQELNFPSYATLSSATVTLNDMGDRTISAQVKIDGSIVPDFSYDWEVEFKGERYIQPLRQPQASKGNESMRSTIDLVFYHKTIWQLKRYYFVEMTSTESGTAIADEYIAPLGLNLSDFCVAFQKVLDHYFDGEITIDLNPDWEYANEPSRMSISYSYIWDVLQKMYEAYGVRWHIEGNTIKVGYPSPILSHTFQYGYEGGLLQVERQVQDANIRNSLLGRGGEQNLPAYYFKEAPEGSLFASDPDAIPELENIYFSNLRGKTFRDYVKGWKAKHYGGAPMSEPTEAYTKGYTDTKFSPIEYVEDKESINKYGLLQGALDNNEDIYPSIQGAPNGEDVVVYVEPVTTDEVAESVRKESVITNIEPSYITISMPQNSTSGRHKLSVDFEVPEGKVGYLSYNIVLLDAINKGNDITDNIIFLRKEFTVQNLDTFEKVDSTYYETGKYRYTIDFTLKSESNYAGTIKATVGIEQGYIEVFDSTDNSDKWLPTFDIWVKNIWHSTRNVGESDEQYAERVWRPILDDRQGNEAKVVFSSGWLSGHEDYEFTIVDFAYDNSREYDGSQSEWRLTLAKSDAELEATGKYIPSASTNGQAYAGDSFFFIGIDMPYQYVLWAEERLDNFKTATLNEVSEIQPKWVVRFDKLRLHEGGDNLAEQIVVGGAINLADVRFIDAPALQLYLQSVTYTWSEQTLLYPDIEVVLADTIVPVQNPVAQLQGSIDAINSQLHSIGNVAQVVRKIGDSLYLRKDGVADISKSPTKFVGNVSGNNFRQGKVGGADWGIYRDENGNAIAEFDKIVARKDLEVNNLVINQVSYVGGMQITSAASIVVTRVIEDDNSYQCFFDQKGGSIANLFQVNDIAYSQRFDEENNTTKYYKRVVTEVGVDYITLSKSQADGEGVPMANDIIIHYGNTIDTNRQYVIIRDVIGGGYERMLSDLNSVSSSGVEYYFAGRMDGNTPRWFVGDKGNEFIEYKDGKLQIKAQVTFTEGSSGVENLEEINYITKALEQDTTIDGGLVQTSHITLGYKENDVFIPMSGSNGLHDSQKEKKTIASWWGGGFHDLEDYYDWSSEDGAWVAKSGVDIPSNIPSGLIRFDGTGYFANGNFWWDEEGKIYADPTALFLAFDPNVGEETLQQTILTLLDQVTTFNEMWKLKYDIKGVPYIFSQYDVISQRGVSMYGDTANLDVASIFNGLPIDNETIYWDNGVLKAMGGSGGGGVADSVAWANVTGKPTWITNTKPTYNYSEIQGTPDLSVYALASSLANYALKTSIPTNNNQLTNGAGYITASALIGYATETFVNTAVNGAKDWVEEQQYLTEITSGTIESVLGYQPYDGDTNRLGFLTSSALIGYATQSWVNTALAGYLPLSGGKVNGSITATSFIGNLSGNADSATKLATARTIWGQSFDGTGNVVGDLILQSATNVSSNGDSAILRFNGANYATGDIVTGPSIRAIYDNYYGRKRLAIFQHNANDYTTESEVFSILPNGNVAIGGTTANEKLHVYGNLLTEGGITMYSQRSLKNILSYDGLSLEQLSIIKPIKFTWKDGRDNRYHVGGVADDVETVVPEVVYSANDFLTMDYGNAGFYVAASLIKPVIDHEQRIKILEQENKALRDEINQLRQAS